MMSRREWPITYILDGRRVPKVVSRDEWGEWFTEMDERLYRVGCDTVADDIWISTMFIGIGPRFGPPLLFESMVFGGRLDHTMRRYETWDEAERGHAKLVAMVKLSLQ
jgi:hypothetical protein